MDNQIEQMIIGAFLRGEHGNLVDNFDIEDFPQYGAIYSAITKRIKEGHDVDIIGVSKASGFDLEQLSKLLVMPEINLYSCAIELKNARIKKLAVSGNFISPTADRVREQIKNIDAILNGAKLNKENLAAKYLSELDKRSEIKPVPYGLPGLDKLMGGLRPGELTSLAARPGQGKSAFALNVSLAAVDRGKKVLFFALEMKDIELIDRIVQQNTNIDITKLRKGSKCFTDEEAEEFHLMLDGKLTKYLSGMCIESQVNNIDLMAGLIQEEKPDLVIVDQLSCLKAYQTFSGIRERFSYCTSKLKRITVECDIPILLLAQLSREAEGVAANLSHLKESGSIEEDSDNVILLSPDKNSNDVLLDVAKHRQGQTEKYAIQFIRNKCKFYEKY